MRRILASLGAAAILSANVSFAANDGVLSDHALYRRAHYTVALGKGIGALAYAVQTSKGPGAANNTQGWAAHDTTNIFILGGNTRISDSGGMDAYAIGRGYDAVIDGFDEDDDPTFPRAFFGGTLADIASHLSAAVDTPEGLHFEFYDGAITSTLRNVPGISALQGIAF